MDKNIILTLLSLFYYYKDNRVNIIFLSNIEYLKSTRCREASSHRVGVEVGVGVGVGVLSVKEVGVLLWALISMHAPVNDLPLSIRLAFFNSFNTVEE